MTGGSGPKRKGGRVERERVTKMQEAGFAAERVPNSGNARGKSFKHDINVPLLGVDRRFEVKARGNGQGFKMLYDWLAGSDDGEPPPEGLILKADHKEALYVIPERLALEVARWAEIGRKR